MSKTSWLPDSAFLFESRDRPLPSTRSFSRIQKPADALRNFIVIDKLAPAGLRNAVIHSGNKDGLAFEHIHNLVLDQLLSILTFGLRHLLKPRLNFGSQIVAGT
ncbi:MAG: hypothetical protein K7J46_18110 [Bryobacter sp.]|jgi:hypothetical protein|nr:hypothetical protein [Bryobacter sp. CoA8 C33]